MNLAPSIIAAAAALLLGGCAVSGDSRIEPATTVPDSTKPPPATSGVDAELLGAGNLRVVSTYPSASGRWCRRLATEAGAVVPRVSCRQEDGRWKLGRSLGREQPGAMDDGGESPIGKSTRTVVPTVRPDRTAVH